MQFSFCHKVCAHHLALDCMTSFMNAPQCCFTGWPTEGSLLPCFAVKESTSHRASTGEVTTRAGDFSWGFSTILQSINEHGRELRLQKL